MECESLAIGGRGVCRVGRSDGDGSRGLVLFCERALPGERLRARISRVAKGGRCCRRTAAPGRAMRAHSCRLARKRCFASCH